MNKLVGNTAPDPEALAKMRLARCGGCPNCKTVEASKQVLADNPCAGRWYAYQNRDMGHPQLGHLQFLHCGPGNTFKTPPNRMPDTARSLGWRYLLVGVVNLSTGSIEDIPTGEPPVQLREIARGDKS